MIIFLRGHIRNSFRNDDLYNLLKAIQSSNELELYICTWSVFSSSSSYRIVEENNSCVTIDTIHAYFRDLVATIKLVKIMEEQTVMLTGKTEGSIGHSCPIRGWKYMIYNIYHLIETIYKSGNNRSNILTTRFDILQLACNRIRSSYILDFIQKYKDTQRRVVFTKGRTRLHCGCDNLMIGKIQSLYMLFYNLNFKLDDVISRNPSEIHQEHYVMLEHNYLESLRKSKNRQYSTVYKPVQQNNIPLENI